MSAVAARLADGRLHLQHGPIDLIIEAFGAAAEVERAYGQAIDRFGDILPTLVRELPTLRRPVGDVRPLLQGPVARRMAEAVRGAQVAFQNGYMWRYDELTNRLRDMCREGRFGRGRVHL